MKLSTTTAKSLLVKSNLPASDYVVNPYVGCTHNCLYCYAAFMKRFTRHDEDWGDFLDVKEYETYKFPKDLCNKTVLLSSVTDPYNPYEMRYHKSRDVLERLSNTDACVEILSKSDLMIKDIDVLKKIPNLSVGISMNTVNDEFRREVEPGAPSIQRRLKVLEELHNEGLKTYLFISPIFPFITNVREIIDSVVQSIDKVCFENLNLQGATKARVFEYIEQKYPQYLQDYRKIYIEGDLSYWSMMEEDIADMAKEYSIPFVNYFYHEKIKKGEQGHDKFYGKKS